MGLGVNSSLLGIDSIVPGKTTHPKEFPLLGENLFKMETKPLVLQLELKSKEAALQTTHTNIKVTS